MGRTRVLILLVAIGCAVLAAVLARGMIGQQADAPVSAEAPIAATVPVLVAAKDLAVGERLSGPAVQWRDWPRGNLDSFMITRDSRPNAMQEIDGSRARLPIFLGEPIAERKILAPAEGGMMSTLLRKGLRAVAIRISDRSAASGFILPNDRVDIIATLRVEVETNVGEDSKEIVFSRTIITNARVLAINQILTPDDRPSLTELKTAVLELDPQQAEIVARSETQGELSLALRSIGEAADASAADEMPALASLSEVPSSVEMYKQGVRFIFSCEPRCDTVLQTVNAPFPLVIRDVGIDKSASNR